MADSPQPLSIDEQIAANKAEATRLKDAKEAELLKGLEQAEKAVEKAHDFTAKKEGEARDARKAERAAEKVRDSFKRDLKMPVRVKQGVDGQPATTAPEAPQSESSASEQASGEEAASG